METCSVVLTFESVDEILWCDHANETSLANLGLFLHFDIQHSWELITLINWIIPSGIVVLLNLLRYSMISLV